MIKAVIEIAAERGEITEVGDESRAGQGIASKHHLDGVGVPV